MSLRRRLALALGVAMVALMLGGGLRARYAAGREGARLMERARDLDVAARRTEWEHALHERRPALSADRARIAVLAPLLVAGTRADAGPVLNSMLEWPVPWPERPRSAVRVAPEVMRLLSGWGAWGEGDARRLAEIDFRSVDLAWMRQLSQFDHWELERNSPWDAVSEDDDAAGWYPDREPRLEGLTPWVKLRLMKGLADGEPWDALGETRQLVRLLLSTESLLASVEAMVILGLEREAYVAALASHPDELARWHAVGDAETAPAAIRYWRALPSLLGIAAPRDVFEDAAGAATPGRCAALRETIRAARALRPLLDAPYADGYARIEALTGRLAECRLTRLRAAVGAPSLRSRWRAFGRIGGDARLLRPDDDEAPALRRLALLLSPPLRATVGSPLLYDAAIAAIASGRPSR